MRTSLTEIEQIEHWLLKQGDPQERILTEAKMIVSPDFKEKAEWQAETYRVIHEYGRERLKQQIAIVENELFQSVKHRSFQNRIRAIFK